MENDHPPIVNLEPSKADTASVWVEFAPGSIWFKGHFPSRPILPGVALLVFLEQYVYESTGMRITGFKRTKFTKPVLPSERLRLSLDLKGSSAEIKYAFIVESNGEKVSSGVALVAGSNKKRPTADSI